MTKTIDIIIGGFDDGRTPSVQQYDTNSRRLLCRLWEKPGVPYTMSENAVVGVIFKWRKAEPAGEYKTEIIDQSTVLVTIPGDATQVSGAVFMQLVFHQDGGVMRSPELCFMTLESLAAGEEGIENPELLFDKLIEEANAATERANDAADALEKISAMATTLPAGREATAEVIDTEDGKLIVIGVPKGEKGEKGDTGDVENDVTPVTSVNDVMPQEDGNVELKLSDMIFDDPEEDLGDDSTTIVLPVVVDEAENAKKLGGVPASDYATKEDLENIPTGGATNVAYNLLDNSYFERMSEIVNQRGFVSGNSVPSWDYFIDRWINTSDAARVFALTDNGMVLEADTTLCQKLGGVKSGTVLTFAACLSDGTIAAVTGTVTYNSDNSWLRLASGNFDGFDLYIDTYAGLLQAIVYTRSNAELRWVALYEGEYTVETLPPYVPKGYAAELLECQRYFFTFNNYGNYSVPIANGYMANTTLARLLIRLPVPMRTNPTYGSLSVPANGIQLRAANSSFENVTITVLGNNKNGVILHCVLPSGKTTTAHATCTLMFAGEESGAAYLYFSADL